MAHDDRRRVVVTGLGAVTPLGDGVEHTWARLLNGESGIRRIEGFDTGDLPCKIAGQLPPADGPGGWDADSYVAAKERRRMDDFIVYALAAASQAMDDSGFVAEAEEDANRAGVMIGSGIGGLKTIEQGALLLRDRGPRRLSPFFIPSSLINLASGHVSIRFGLKGPNHAVVTACATGAHAIGDATRLIEHGDADVMVAGGSEAAVCPLGVAGFAAARALSTAFNDEPTRASRPWDSDRDGFVMGEGAAVVVLEELRHAVARGATIHAEILGYGLSGDAHHVTAPSEDGDGGFRSMRNAMAAAGLGPDDIDYVNAHGTSTPVGDEIEFGAVKRLFGNAAAKISMSSTKSAIGHLLGAAGSVEAIFAILAVRDGVVPPTLNLERPSQGCDGIDLVPHRARRRPVRVALSNSFGFGGTNASLIVGKAP